MYNKPLLNTYGVEQDKVVAFIDILGFKEMVNESFKYGSYYGNILSALKTIDNMRHLKVDSDSSVGHEVTVFSDNIVISYKRNYLDLLIRDVIDLQISLLADGMLTRGGVSFGKLCHEDNLVYGPALIEAYLIESKYAIYPRVVIDNKFFCDGEVFDVFEAYKAMEANKAIKRDFDDLYYISILDDIITFRYRNGDLIYDVVKKVIESKLKENVSLGIKAKYGWLKNYFNKVAKANRLDLLEDSSY